ITIKHCNKNVFIKTRFLIIIVIFFSYYKHQKKYYKMSEFAVYFKGDGIQSNVNISKTNTVTDLKERIRKQIIAQKIANDPTTDPTSIQDDLNSKNVSILAAGKYRMTEKKNTNN